MIKTQEDYDCSTSLLMQQLAERKGWQDKYRLLIRWADDVSLPWDIRTDENLIVGCESAAWLICYSADDQHYEFLFDSESRIIKGLAVLLLSEIHDKCAEDINSVSLDGVLRYCGLGKHLSPSRTNGLRALMNKVRESISASIVSRKK